VEEVEFEPAQPSRRNTDMAPDTLAFVGLTLGFENFARIGPDALVDSILSGHGQTLLIRFVIVNNDGLITAVRLMISRCL
jgi:hypothetical protein